MSTNETTTFLGHPVSFWRELKAQADQKFPCGYERIMAENMELRGKVSFYETRIRELVAVERKP